PPLFSLQAWKCTRRVNNGDDRLSEFPGHLHKSECFAVSFRISPAKVTLLPLLGISPFLLSDKHDRSAVDVTQPSNHGLVIFDGTVAVDLDKVIGDFVDIIQCVGPVGMPG